MNLHYGGEGGFLLCVVPRAPLSAMSTCCSHSLHIPAAVLDKDACKLHATCTTQMQTDLAELTVLDPQFRIVGVPRCNKAAARYLVPEIL